MDPAFASPQLVKAIPQEIGFRSPKLAAELRKPLHASHALRVGSAVTVPKIGKPVEDPHFLVGFTVEVDIGPRHLLSIPKLR
jgi:hypothetical protein